MPNTTTATGSMALLLVLGCSTAEDGASGAGGDGAAGGSGALAGTAGGGLASTGGASAGAGGTVGGGGSLAGTDGAATSCESAFSGPELRDCSLPGACGRCMWEKACPQFLFQCAHDAGCVCTAECVATAGVASTESCLGQCGLSASPPGFTEWVKLASDMCWDEGCGRLSSPPPDPPSTSGASIGAGTEPDCLFDANLPYDPCGSILQLQSADGSICMRIDRRNDGPGTDFNTAWTLLDVLVGPLGEVCHTNDPGALCWFASHHNFGDWAHVSCGNRHYDLNVASNCGVHNTSPSPTFRLHVSESAPPSGGCGPTNDGVCPIGTPIDLFPVP